MATATATTATAASISAAASTMMAPDDSVPTKSPMDRLCDNTLAHILSFLDFRSLMRVSRMTSATLTRRILCDASPAHLWKEIFDRHLFAPLPPPPSSPFGSHARKVGTATAAPAGDSCYLAECQRRRRIFQNLTGRRRGRRAKSSCFNLPNRHFYFVPVAPREDDSEDDWNGDLPMVDFDCPSFLLTNPGTSGELLFLDPFDGSLVVHRSCLDNAVASDEAMMEQAMKDAAHLIHKRKDLKICASVKDEHIAGAVIDSAVFRNHNMQQYHQDPEVVLMSTGDYFNIELSEYFVLSSSPHHAHTRHGHRRDDYSQDIVLHQDEEVEIDLVGIDAKPIISRANGDISGTMVAVGRTLCTEAEGWNTDPKVCSELMAWKKTDRHDYERLVCRVRSPYKVMEMDPTYERVYISFPIQEGPFRRFDVSDADTDRVDFEGGGRVVAAYPLEPYTHSDNDNEHATMQDYQRNDATPRHFPKPEFILRCTHPVSSIAVSPGGETVLLATVKGTIEFWKTDSLGATRQSIIDIKAAVKRADTGTSSQTSTTADARGVVDSPPPESPAMDEDNDLQVDEPGMSSVVTSFHFPLFQPLDRCGFVTLHHVHGQGSWLILWTKNKQRNQFEASCSINLPLSARRKPCIHYDGRRLIVLGQDHIGMILLVYHVLNSWEDLDSFESRNVSYNKFDESAGVHHLGQNRRECCKFSNRIRHAALGGLEYYDAVYMSVNERFIIVNTKTGNLLGPSPGTDGLLVIDLEDYDSR